MTRRVRMVAAVTLLAASAILVFWTLNQSPAREGSSSLDIPKQRRSVLIVTVDTTRADRLEPYGAENVSTPRLQEFAEQGIVFENAASVAPITLPAHTTIMTGLYPFEHGVRNNGLQYVPEDVETLAETLFAEGYRTGAFVSAAVLERRYGLDQGFEIYDDDLSTGVNRSDRTVADRPANAVVDSATAWLDTLGDDDEFFSWVHFYDPHAGYSPPPPFRDEYRGRPYEGEIAFMDQEIGRLLDHPRVRLDGDDPPIVVVIGDHGESLGEHGEQTHAILAYDSTLHVPFLLRVPGGPAGERVSATVHQVDLMPTILAALDLDLPAGSVSGRNLLDLGTPAFDNQAVLYSETYLPYYTYGWSKLQSIRQGRWKYIAAPTPELYDLHRDPRELSNVYERQPGPAYDLTQALETILAQAEDSEAEAKIDLDQESLEQLRSLGYLAVGSGPPGRTTDRPDPKDVIDLHVALERGRTMLADRLGEQAERKFREVLQRDPENLAALIELVSALEMQDRLDEAAEAAERALGLDPEYLRLYTLLARLETERGETEKALGLLETAWNKDPRNPAVVSSYAAQLDRAGESEKAAEILFQGLEAVPNNDLIEMQIARIVELPSGRLDEAIARLEGVVARDPFLSGAWLLLGRSYEADRRGEEAVQAYESGLQRESDNPDLHLALGNVLAKLGRQNLAEQHLREGARLSPRFRPGLHVALGAVLAEQGRLPEAVAEYRKVLDKHPEHPGARNNLAIAMIRSGEMARARGILRKLVEEQPRNIDAHINLAAVAVNTQQWETAEVHSRRVLELDDRSPEAWNNLGVAREEQGDFREARSSYDRALALDPEYWPARINLGILMRKQGDLEAATAMLNSVLEKVPQSADAHYHLAMVHLESPESEEHTAKARIHMQAFLRHAPSDPRADEVRRRLDQS